MKKKISRVSLCLTLITVSHRSDTTEDSFFIKCQIFGNGVDKLMSVIFYLTVKESWRHVKFSMRYKFLKIVRVGESNFILQCII